MKDEKAFDEGDGMLTNTVLPPWLALPVTGIMMLVISAHIGVLRTVPMVASRRRIRVSNGWVMLMGVPMLGAGFGVINQADTRLFVLVWGVGIGLLAMSLGLAFFDILNSFRLNARARRRLEHAAMHTTREIVETDEGVL